MKIVFMGTPDFAVPCLEKLIEKGHVVAGVFTQPDKPVGRKQILTAPPVKVCANSHNIPVYQPVSLKKDNYALETIKSLNPDAIVVVAYGKILTKDILQAANYGCINVHASLLPKYRGAAPIQWAVLNGDSETGVTIMQMDEGLDTGDILFVEKTPIDIDETAEELFDRLSLMGADALLKCLDMIENKTAKPIKQDESKATHVGKITKDLCPINWSKSALDIHNQVRGLQSWPCASTLLLGKSVKIHKTKLSNITANNAGEVVDNKGKITVCCGDGKCLDIIELQLDGKKRMDTKSYLAGNKIEIGTLLGE